MKRIGTWKLRAAVTGLVLLGSLALRVTAQAPGAITGQIFDLSGNPWPNIVVQDVNDQGAKIETKTDEKGKYTLRGLKPGVHTLSIILPMQEKPFETKCQVGGDKDTIVDLNFKEIVEKQNPQFAEQLRKQAEEKQKFQGMKAHFDAGNALLDQVRQTKNDLSKAPADQRDVLKQKLTDLSTQAATEYQAAQKAAPENDSNWPLFWAKLGEVYDLAGRKEEAINAYQQAVTLKPTAAYYNNLGNVQASAGKIDDARAAYMKSIELDPANAAQAWRNFGIVLYNSNRLAEAVEPLQKSIELEPKSAQSWYLLGAALLSKMTTKQTGDKMEVVFAPGTVEAYERAIELDPNGPYGAQAKQGLADLQQMAPGIQTKFTTKKKKT